MTLRFVRNSLVYFGGNVINQAIPFLLLPVFTRYLTPSDYGVTAAFGTVVALLVIFIGLMGHTAINRMYFDLGGTELSIYVGTAFITAIGCFVIALAGTGMIAIIGLSEGGLPATWLLLAPCVALANFVTTTNQVLWSAQQKAVPFVSYTVARSSCYFALSTTLVVAAGLSWQGVIIAQTVVFVSFGLLSQWILQRRGMLVWRWSRQHALHILRYSIPLLPNALAAWTRNALDRIVIVALVDLHAAGIYAAAVALTRAIAVVIDSISITWKNHAFAALKRDRPEDRRQLVAESCAFIALAAVLGVTYALAAPRLLGWFLGERFHEAFALLPIVVISEVFDAWRRPSSTFLLYVQRTRPLAAITVSTSAAHVGLLLVLTSTYGAMGAAIASAITNFLVFLGLVVLSQRVYPMPWLDVLWRRSPRDPVDPPDLKV